MTMNEILKILADRGRLLHDGVLPEGFTIKERPHAPASRRWKGKYPDGSIVGPTREIVEDHLWISSLPRLSE